MDSLIAHKNGVVALIMTMSDTTNTINSFVLGSSFMLYDSGLLEMLLHYCLTDNCTDAAEDKAENNEHADCLNIDRSEKVICIFCRISAVDKILTVGFSSYKDREIVCTDPEIENTKAYNRAPR